tara:strand:+ start:37776 stop:38786 length:1011 start_codon:yes stop_codon:yes gene_type:complete
MIEYNYKKILVTGGAGFIGSAFIEKIYEKFKSFSLLNIDKLTYAASNRTLDLFTNFPDYNFKEIDINDFSNLSSEVLKFNPDLVINFAAESHVDNSITSSKQFLESNVLGTYNLLEIALKIIKKKENFLFHQISTDEIYGDLNEDDLPFNEESRIRPSSPYSSTKAASDLLVKAWGRTYKLPFLITNCSNNFGPRQYYEKIIPKIISNYLDNKTIPLYGDGENIRDWIYVYDHIEAIFKLHQSNIVNDVFNIGANNERSNIALTNLVLNHLDKIYKKANSKKSIEFVEDRKGHDFRYAIDSKKLKEVIDWKPEVSFEKGIELTIDWYLENKEWWNE